MIRRKKEEGRRKKEEVKVLRYLSFIPIPKRNGILGSDFSC
ncbi:hypothetical protein [Okeania sp. KiyG1]|nr:hypothetical protein [Okeania sp. KiyG1]